MDSTWLVSCVVYALYFTIGPRLEVQKLVKEFGGLDRYYPLRIPSSLPGRYLGRTEAAAL